MGRYWYRAVQSKDKTARRIEPEAAMEEEEVERLCQAVSPNDEPCDYPATVHCTKCGRWFCDAHAEDEEWHPCMLPSGDEGGEA
jgi:hypothetical protein